LAAPFTFQIYGAVARHGGSAEERARFAGRAGALGERMFVPPRSWSCARPRAQSPSDGHRMTVLHPEDTLRADIGIELSAESEAFEPRNLVI